MRSGLQIAATSITLALCATAQATVSIDNTVDAASVTGVVQNNWGLNTDVDLIAVALYMELDSGSLHDPFTSSMTLDGSMFGFSGDSYIAANDSQLTGIAGGAGDLGHFNQTSPGNFDWGPTTTGVTWFSPGADTADIGSGLPLGRLSLTDDAQGTWSMAVTTAFSDSVLYLSNPVIDGEMLFAPLQGDLDFNGYVGVDDLNTVLGAWNQSVPAGNRTAGDPSGDGFVGIEDLNMVLGNWNEGLAPLVPGSVSSPYYGDQNADGFVGIDDLTIWLSNWNLTIPPGDPRADPSGDNFVGIEDKVYSDWNAGTPPTPVGGYTPPVVTPEPTSVGLMAIGGMLLLRRRA